MTEEKNRIKNTIIFLFIPTVCFFVIICFLIYYESVKEVNEIIEANEEEIIKYYDTSDDIEEYVIGSDNEQSFIYSLIKENNSYKVTYKNSDEFNKVLTYDKTIKNTHFDYRDDAEIYIPHYVYYSEYNEEYSMTFNGILEFINLTVYKNSLVAEYSGTLYNISEYNEYK